MTYIPIVVPIIAGQNHHRGSKPRAAGIMMILIMGILTFLGFYLFKMNLPGVLSSISLKPTIMVGILILMGIVIATTMVYKVEMKSENAENIQAPLKARETVYNDHIRYDQKTQSNFTCPACQNSLDDVALKGLLENDVIYCQHCGEKIHR